MDFPLPAKKNYNYAFGNYIFIKKTQTVLKNACNGFHSVENFEKKEKKNFENFENDTEVVIVNNYNCDS